MSQQDESEQEWHTSCASYLNSITANPTAACPLNPLIEGFTHLMIVAATCDHKTTKAVLDCRPEQVNLIDCPHYLFHLTLM
jgi:hypothetical protein